MNRRKFLKTMLGGAVVAALPGCKFPAGPTESVAIDLAKPGSDVLIVGELGRYESVRFIESTPEGRMYYSQVGDPNVWSNNSWHEKPAIAEHNLLLGRNRIQEEMNKLASNRMDRIKKDMLSRRIVG